MNELIKNLQDKFSVLKKNRIVKNLFVILSADMIVSAIGIINMSLVLKTIGLYGNGIITLIQTYALLFNDIFNFQSFNALIKYLPMYTLNKKKDDIKSLLKQSFVLDIITAIIATVFGYIFIIPVASFMEWDKTIMIYIAIYLITILFNITGTPIGILRNYNKFNYNTNVNLIVSIFKLIFYFIGFIMEKSFVYFIFLEVVLELMKNILLIYASMIVLKKLELMDFYKAKMEFDKKFFNFNFYSNIVSTLDIPVKHLSTFIINKFLGFEIISVFKVFQKLGSIIEKIGVPLSQIIYPEISQMIARKKYSEAFNLNKKLVKVSLIFGAIILFLTTISYKIWAGWFIPDFDRYIALFLFYLTYIIVSYCGVGLHSIFMGLGYIKYNVPILIVINPIYCILLMYMTKNFGLLGLIGSLMLQTLAILVTKYIIIFRDKKKFTSDRGAFIEAESI